MPNCYKQLLFGAIFDFHGFQKDTLWITFSLKQSIKRNSPNDPGSTSRDPVFYETIIITVQFGPSVFFKGHLFDGDWLVFIFCIMSFFVLCFI